jgi:hypothetical protein
VSHLSEAARGVTQNFLAAMGTRLYLMGFFGAVYTALDKLAY